VTEGKLLHTPKNAARLLDCGLTKLYGLMNRRRVDTVTIDGMRRITDESLRRLASTGDAEPQTKRPPVQRGERHWMRRRRPTTAAPPAGEEPPDAA
jgi:hypothetical protein